VRVVRKAKVKESQQARGTDILSSTEKRTN
jgi:hypothetical protein